MSAPVASSPTLAHVHETPLAVATVEMTPPHPPRIETPAYQRAHHFLVVQQNRPCMVCGVTRRTLRSPAKNPAGATQIETHHYPIERSLADACDPVKVHADYPQVYDRATLVAWVDSPANLIVLCDVHHRSTSAGIHHLAAQDFAVQKYLYTGYVVVATAKDAAQVLAADERIVDAIPATTPAQPANPSPVAASASPVTDAGQSGVTIPPNTPRLTGGQRGHNTGMSTTRHAAQRSPNVGQRSTSTSPPTPGQRVGRKRATRVAVARA